MRGTEETFIDARASITPAWVYEDADGDTLLGGQTTMSGWAATAMTYCSATAAAIC